MGGDQGIVAGAEVVIDRPGYDWHGKRVTVSGIFTEPYLGACFAWRHEAGHELALPIENARIVTAEAA